MSEMKRCSKCREEKPATKDYFYFREGKIGSVCKECSIIKSHNRYHNVVKLIPPKKKEYEGRARTCKLLPYSKELNMYLKTCTKCHREFPATNEYFYSSKNGKCSLGVYCKECRGQRFTPIPKEGYIVCYTCGKELLANEENFLPREYSLTGYRGVCRTCRSSQESIFRIENIDMMHERDRQADIKRKDFKKEWRFRTYWDNPELFAQRNKENRAKHIEKRLAYGREKYRKNPELHREISKRWNKEHPEAYRASINKCRQKRRARKRDLPHDFTVKEWETCKEYFGNVCAYCGENTTMDHDLDQEHFISVENGGGYTFSNIIPACRSCNSRKHTAWFEKWYPSDISYSSEREAKILNYLNIENKSKIQQISFAI